MNMPEFSAWRRLVKCSVSWAMLLLAQLSSRSEGKGSANQILAMCLLDDILHFTGVMINMDESCNEDSNDSSPEPDPVSQSYLNHCVIRTGSARTEVSVWQPELCHGQTCGGTEVATAGLNTVAVHRYCSALTVHFLWFTDRQKVRTPSLCSVAR